MNAQHRLGEPRPDSGGGLEQFEDHALVIVGEPEERQRVFADDEGGGESGRLADPHPRDRLGGAVDLDAKAAHLDHHEISGDRGYSAGDEGDHLRAAKAVWAWLMRAAAAPRQASQIASARASVASAGATRPGALSSLRTMNATCSLPARP